MHGCCSEYDHGDCFGRQMKMRSMWRSAVRWCVDASCTMNTVVWIRIRWCRCGTQVHASTMHGRAHIHAAHSTTCRTGGKTGAAPVCACGVAIGVEGREAR